MLTFLLQVMGGSYHNSSVTYLMRAFHVRLDTPVSEWSLPEYQWWQACHRPLHMRPLLPTHPFLCTRPTQWMGMLTLINERYRRVKNHACQYDIELTSVTWFNSEEKWVVHHINSRCLHKTPISAFTIRSPIRQAKFNLPSIITNDITNDSSFGLCYLFSSRCTRLASAQE